MPLTSIKLVPGISSVKTPTLLELGWTAGSNIRFFQGLPQKDAGFMKLIEDAGLGTIRALKAWQTLALTKYLGIASEGPLPGLANMLSVWQGTVVTDITPAAVGASG